MENCESEFLTTRRGKPSLVVGGYKHRLYRRSNTLISWRCARDKKEKCNGKIKTNLRNEIVSKTDHTCTPNVFDIVVSKKIEQCLKRIREELSVPVNMIYKQEFSDLIAKGLVGAEGIPKYDNIKTRLCKERRIALGLDPPNITSIQNSRMDDNDFAELWSASIANANLGAAAAPSSTDNTNTAIATAQTTATNCEQSKGGGGEQEECGGYRLQTNQDTATAPDSSETTVFNSGPPFSGKRKIAGQQNEKNKKEKVGGGENGGRPETPAEDVLSWGPDDEPLLIDDESCTNGDRPPAINETRITTENADECTVFGQYIACKLRNLNDKQLLATAQNRITNFLYQLEMGNLNARLETS